MDMALYEKYYEGKLAYLDIDEAFVNLLTVEDAQILTNIGIPPSIEGRFKVLTIPKFFEDKYLGIYEFQSIYICINTLNSEIVCYSDQFEAFAFYATNIRCFIESNYEYVRFVYEILLPEALGKYDDNRDRYVAYLKNLVEPIDARAIKEGQWTVMLEEMGYGIY